MWRKEHRKKIMSNDDDDDDDDDDGDDVLIMTVIYFRSLFPTNAIFCNYVPTGPHCRCSFMP